MHAAVAHATAYILPCAGTTGLSILEEGVVILRLSPRSPGRLSTTRRFALNPPTHGGVENVLV